MTSVLLILFSPAGQQNDSLKNIVSQTHQQLRVFQVTYNNIIMFGICIIAFARFVGTIWIFIDFYLEIAQKAYNIVYMAVREC